MHTPARTAHCGCMLCTHAHAHLEALGHVYHDACGAVAVRQDVQQVGGGHKVEAREGAALALHVVGQGLHGWREPAGEWVGKWGKPERNDD